VPYRLERLARAAQRFETAASAAERADLAAFTARQAHWLPDYALFMALDEHFGAIDWCDWDAPLARRDAAALTAAEVRHADRIAFWTFCQWCFDRQWQRCAPTRTSVACASSATFRSSSRTRAPTCGRAPICSSSMRRAAERGRRSAAGSLQRDRPALGQSAVPLTAHARDGYGWWIERIRHTLARVDLARIDHFRGFAAHWEIAAQEPTAINGHWVQGPGAALFDAIAAALGPLPLIAEDLGVITPDVDSLRRRFGFPGMRVLQFAWAQGDGSANRYLPHNHQPDSVTLTGTHDNDTTLGWWASAPEAVRHHVREYLATDGSDIAWDLIRAAHASGRRQRDRSAAGRARPVERAPDERAGRRPRQLGMALRLVRRPARPCDASARDDAALRAQRRLTVRRHRGSHPSIEGLEAVRELHHGD
jgi:4-alpha-glucanotransferase